MVDSRDESLEKKIIGPMVYLLERALLPALLSGKVRAGRACGAAHNIFLVLGRQGIRAALPAFDKTSISLFEALFSSAGRLRTLLPDAGKGAGTEKGISCSCSAGDYPAKDSR